MKKLHLILVLLLISFSTFAQMSANIEEIKQYYSKQDYITALNLSEKCIENDSLDLACREQAGLCAFRLGQFPKARAHFLKIGSNPDYFKTAYISLASIYEQQENIPKAIKYNSMLKDSFPENPIYYRKLGALYLKAKILSEAFPKYAKALELNPSDLISIKALSEIFIANEQFEDADSLLNVGLEIDQESISLALLLAKNYYVQKEYDSTVVVLESLLGRLDFTNYYNKMMGYALLQIDSIDKCIPYLQKSLVDESNPEYAHYYLANAYEVKEDFETATFHYEKAIKAGASPGLHTYHRNLARIYNEDNNLKEAIEHYKLAYQYRKDPLLLMFLAQASDTYYKDKNIAINYYRRYLNSNAENETYKKYARERIQYLKEIKHLEVRN